MNEVNILESGSIPRLIARFAIPSILAMLVNALYNIVDQIFIGRGVGFLGNGAANVVLLITLITLAFSLWIGDGTAAFFSLRLGEKKKQEAGEGFGCAMVLITLISLVMMGVSALFLKEILYLFGCTDILYPYAQEYGIIIVLGLPFIMISTSLNALIRCDGSPKYAMKSMIIGALINGCLDPIFIFVFGWGMKGAALSTFIGQFVSFIISMNYLRRFQSIHLTSTIFRLRFTYVKAILKLGISSFIDQLAFALVMSVNNNLMVHYGALSAYGSEIPISSYGIAMKVQEILFTLILGIAMGLQPIAGYNYGAKKYQRVKEAYKIAVLIATIISTLAMILFIFFPDPIISLFGSQDNLAYVEFSRKFFQTYFLLYIFFGFQTISGVFFQAIGKPMKSAILSLSYQLIFKITSALLLCSWLGIDGVLWSGPLADALALILCFYFVYHQIKELKQLENDDFGNVKPTYAPSL